MSKLRTEKGFVSLLVLLLIAFLSWIGFEVFYKVSSQERIVRYEAQKIKAIFIADSGLEWAKASLTKDPDWKGGTKIFTDGEVKVEIIKNVQGYRVIARSQSENTVQCRFGDFIDEIDKGLTLVSYGELFQ